MNKILSVIGVLLMWVVVIGFIALLTLQSRARREALSVSRVEISIVDSTEQGNLITTRMVQDMLSDNKIKCVGRKIDDAPLQQIEGVIRKNGFVESVKTYVDYNGTLKIDVTQRSAVLRLLLDGYNCYITRDGFIFKAPSTTAIYTPVVTGRYRPLFGSGYVGHIEEYKQQQIAKIQLEIDRVEREKYPILLRERENAELRRDIRKRYINRSAFESKDAFARRVATLREDNRLAREACAKTQRTIDSELKALEQRQERYRDQQKNVEKKCDDIYNLITFVDMLEDDDFWRAEVVQIDIEERDIELRASLAVRSGSFIVTIGELTDDSDELEAKFKRLRGFYDKALSRVGWDRYREINLEFENQVVCRR